MSIRLKKPILMISIIVGGLFISSCTLIEDNSPSGVELPTATPGPTEVSGGAAEEDPTATATSLPEATAAREETATGPQDPSELPDQGPIPTGSSLLKSTDPATVDLADGEPKLVEFFAFW